MGVTKTWFGGLVLALALCVQATGAMAQGCPQGQQPSLGWCCPADAMWDRRYRQCVADPRPRCARGELAQCVTVGEHYVGVGDYAQATIYHRKACTGGELSGCVALGYMAHRGQGRRVDPQAARTLFERACKGGHAAGCTGLAEVSLASGTASDEATAQIGASCERGELRACALSVMTALDGGEPATDAQREQARRACDAGHAVGCVAHARLLAVSSAADGRARALELLDRGCRAGEAVACRHQGALLADGSVPADVERARAPLQQACAGGVGAACAQLAEMFAAGQGGAQDGSRAREHHRQACELGLDSSCLRFGEMTMALPKDARDGATLRAVFERGCQRGSAPMCLQLAGMLLDAEGGPRERDRARELLKGGCEGGAPEPCALLADSHGWQASAERGAEARAGYGFAVQYLTRACALRDAGACTRVGLLHMAGSHGVRRDFGVAARSFERACHLGDADGCLYVGRQATFGHGRERDDGLAAAQLQKACSMGAMAACADAKQTPAVELYPAPYAPGAEPPPRHREPQARARPPHGEDSERVPLAWGERAPDAERPPAETAATAPPAEQAADARGAGLGVAARIGLTDGDGQRVVAAVLQQRVALGRGFEAGLSIPLAFGSHAYAPLAGALEVREVDAMRFGNVRFAVTRKQGDSDTVIATTLAAVLPTAIAAAGDADPRFALNTQAQPELARPTLGVASAIFGMREHDLWAWDAGGMTAELTVRGRADILRYAAEIGISALAPVRERDVGEFAADAYGEIGFAVGSAVLALGVGAGYADEEDAGMVTVEPSLQHVTASGERLFLKLAFVLERSDVTARTATPEWSLQLGARF